jgi:hypothetical protein
LKEKQIRQRYNPSQKETLLSTMEKLVNKYGVEEGQNEFKKKYPNVRLETVRRWPAKKTSIAKAANNKKLRGRRNISIKPRGAQFPEQEDELWDLFKERRLEGLPCGVRWIKQTMLEIMKKQKPAGYEKFKASAGWVVKWTRRYDVSTRVASNKKSLSVADRLPKVMKFHRAVKKIRKSEPERCPNLGRFPAKATFSG